jgi:hypothetical protein
MRPGVVVVLDVGENADEVPFAADQEPVQAFGTGARHLRVVSIKCRGVRVVVIQDGKSEADLQRPANVEAAPFRFREADGSLDEMTPSALAGLACPATWHAPPLAGFR